MALSLTQTTANNVSGSYTPNITLNGYFQLSLSGFTTLNLPTGLVLTPQIIVISVQTPDIGDPPGTLYMSWASGWGDWLQQYSVYGPSPASNPDGTVFTCLVGIGLARILSRNYWQS